MPFTSLPPETVEHIILHLDPIDVSVLSRTSRYFYDIIYPSSENATSTIASSTVQYIWKNLYLSQPLDDPTTCYSVLGTRLLDILAEHGAEFDWRKELQEIVRARTIVESYIRRRKSLQAEEAQESLPVTSASSPWAKNETCKLLSSQDRIRTLRTLLNLVTFISPLRSPEDMLTDDKLSSNLMWVAAECRRGSLLDPFTDEIGDSPSEAISTTNPGSFDQSSLDSDENGTGDSLPNRPSRTKPTEIELQLRAKLHTFLGLTPHDWTEDAKLESKSYVYSMKNHHWGNEFGPFREEIVQGQYITTGRHTEPAVRLRVNWVHIHHIQRSVSLKFLESTFTEDHLERMKLLDVFIYQLSFPFTQIVVEEEGEGQENDWAGVTGEWDISFCFVDHRDLLHYNTALHEGSSPEQLRIEAQTLDQTEIFRTMSASLHLTKAVENPSFPNRPTLYFGGEVELGMGDGVISGYVQVMDDSEPEEEGERGRNGVVRWHFVSGETNNLVWSGEGIQVGGVKSAYGVLGSWTTVFHDQDDPIGPFWLRRVYSATNEIPT